ncbi:MAG: flagellar assembly protein A [Clostridiales bacterium]
MKNNKFDGLVWVKDQKVYVKDANLKKDGLPAIINPCEGIKLLINNIEISHLTEVTENDSIEIISLELDKDPKTDLIISNDNMSVYLNYSPQQKIKYSLKDSDPTNKLDFETKENVIEEKKINKDFIYDLLSKNNITYGIKESVITNIIEENLPNKYLIAQGDFSEEPIDEKIEYYFESEEIKKVNLSENTIGNIDYKNMFKYIDVKVGEIIAKIIPFQMGKEGKTVYGDILKISTPTKLNIIDTPDALYDKTKGIVIAKKPGRPIKINKQNSLMFNIIEKLTVENVNMETGNIKFNGDIEVKGFVNESMEVLSKKNVYVKNGCSFATIQAANNIEIKESIISSKIFAAKNVSFGKNPSSELKNASKIITELINNLNNFSQVTNIEKETFHEKLHHLLNNNNKNLPSIIYDIIRKFKRGNYDFDKNNLLTFIKNTRVLLGNYLEIENIEFLENLVESLNLLTLTFDESVITGNVRIGYAINSIIYALGDVYILGKGASNTKIYADGNVHILGNFRGGEIHSNSNVEINSSGVLSGVKTLIEVPFEKTIKIKTLYSETIVKVGSFSHKFLSDKSNATIKIKNNKLHIS